MHGAHALRYRHVRRSYRMRPRGLDRAMGSAHNAIRSVPAQREAAQTLEPSLRSFALAAAASVVQQATDDGASLEVQYLREHLAAVAPAGESWHARLPEYLARPRVSDVPLLALAHELGMTLAELLAVALAAAVEDDLMAGRALAYLQAPVGGSRPTLGLLARLLADLPDCPAALQTLAAGAAERAGVLTLNGESPLPERSMALPVPIALALQGIECDWSGIGIGLGSLPQTVLPPSTLSEAGRHAKALAAAPSRALVIRSGSTVEARAAACVLAAELGRRAAFIETDRLAALGPWLFLRGLLPVMCVELAPGEHRKLLPIPGYRGPLAVVCGPDGTLEAQGEAALSWRVITPGSLEREALWQGALDDSELARSLAREHRHSSARIGELARVARHMALIEGRTQLGHADIVAAARVAEGQGLGALAQPMTELVHDDALVVPAALRGDLDALAARCRARDTLTDTLGPAAITRYHPGVRALFVGPSGTGKTLAASWLATKLGIPMYRIDLAAVTSKYIGETEKNLAQLIARAEHAEVGLLFDEADSLFGKRTDVKDSNDRFANAQTNYLLQRIENFDGIAILTSNSRARFDSGFSRRLDAIIDFPLPGPEERRALWVAHLGGKHGLSTAELNELAATADLAGGHIRNAVFAAAATAHAQARPLVYNDIVRGLAGEYRKLGRHIPAGLAR